MKEAATDTAAARHLAAANDRDYADLAVKVDANRRAINALGEQTRARFDGLETEMRSGFAELRTGLAELRSGHDELRGAMRHGFDQTAAGFARIAELITARDDDRWHRSGSPSPTPPRRRSHTPVEAATPAVDGVQAPTVV